LNTDNEIKIVDHLFRHQSGKMLAILSKIFGLSNLELIEDAVQDTFLQASIKWRNGLPENPEAWLTLTAKNRVIDLLRQSKSLKNRNANYKLDEYSKIDEVYMNHEVEDSQLRMIFVACHPAFSKEDQITFALKAISGFSGKEIASALLQNEETIKKRLSRARKKIKELDIKLEYPDPNEIESRISGVLQIIYLIFNEGFHSIKENSLIDKELCGEALRLTKLLLIKDNFRTGTLYALFALLCFNSSRIDSKILDGEIIDLKNQDRSKWYLPLIVLGQDSLRTAQMYSDRSAYHYEALIAAEHVKAIKFENTNWELIIKYYDEMYKFSPSINILLSKTIAFLQIDKYNQAKEILDLIKPKELNQRVYLYHGTLAEYYIKINNKNKAIEELDKAINSCKNNLEIKYLQKKREVLVKSKN